MCPIALQGCRRGRQGSCHMKASREALGLRRETMPDDGSVNFLGAVETRLGAYIPVNTIQRNDLFWTSIPLKI